MTDTLNKTTICSFYQVSESIYALFDRVLVLDKGRTIYFGPTKQARKYFFDMGFTCDVRKGTADFLSKYKTVCHVHLR
jgi:ABC-type multidrug transport system ATPase subunit